MNFQLYFKAGTIHPVKIVSSFFNYKSLFLLEFFSYAQFRILLDIFNAVLEACLFLFLMKKIENYKATLFYI
jgi:hypothetical protein